LGATPSNIATRLLKPGKVEGLSGAEPPMPDPGAHYREEALAACGREGDERRGRDGVGPPEFGRLQCREPKLKSSTSWTARARRPPKLTQLAASFAAEVWLLRTVGA